MIKIDLKHRFLVYVYINRWLTPVLIHLDFLAVHLIFFKNFDYIDNTLAKQQF